MTMYKVYEYHQYASFRILNNLLITVLINLYDRENRSLAESVKAAGALIGRTRDSQGYSQSRAQSLADQQSSLLLLSCFSSFKIIQKNF